MQKNLPVDAEIGQGRDRAIVSRHRNMSHGLPGLGAEARRDQFVIAPDRAVEEDQRCAGEALFQFGRHLGAGGEEI